jgi:hypothetical protein
LLDVDASATISTSATERPLWVLAARAARVEERDDGHGE